METRVPPLAPARGGLVFPGEVWERKPAGPDADADGPGRYARASGLSAHYTKLASWVASLRFRINPVSQSDFLTTLIQISRTHRGQIYLEKFCVPSKNLAARTAQTGDEGTIHVFHSR